MVIVFWLACLFALVLLVAAYEDAKTKHFDIILLFALCVIAGAALIGLSETEFWTRILGLAVCGGLSLGFLLLKDELNGDYLLFGLLVVLLGSSAAGIVILCSGVLLVLFNIIEKKSLKAANVQRPFVPFLFLGMLPMLAALAPV